MSEPNGLIFEIRKNSQQDGPGVRTAVLFKGCTMSCWWCAAPEVQSPAVEVSVREGRCVRCGSCVTVCPVDAVHEELSGETVRYTVDRNVCIACGSCVGGCQGEARALTGKRMSASEVMQQVAEQAALDAGVLKGLGGGVTFTGGEPLMQVRFLRELLRSSKALGIHTAVDTSGYAPWQAFDQVRSNVDLFLFDLKIIDDERHRQFTGVSNEGILFNLKTLADLGHRIILRVPLIPDITDDEKNLLAIGEFASTLKNLEGVDLNPFLKAADEQYERLGKTYRMVPVSPMTADRLGSIKRLFEQFGLATNLVQ